MQLYIRSLVTIILAKLCTCLVIKAPITILNRNNEISNYVSYNGSSNGPYRLFCNYTLDEDEFPTKIHWTLDSFRSGIQGKYIWSADDSPSALGSLSGAVNLQRNDGQLEVKEPSYDLWGNYTCVVHSSKGASVTNGPKEISIVETSGTSLSKSSDVGPPCEITESYFSNTIFPPPTLELGVYSPSLGKFVSKADNFEWITYTNGSRSVSITNFTYSIDANSPTDFFFLAKMYIKQRDGRIIPLGSVQTRTRPGRYNEIGCNATNFGSKSRVFYTPSNYNLIECRNQYRVNTIMKVHCYDAKSRRPNIIPAIYECSAQAYNWTLTSSKDAEELGCGTAENEEEEGYLTAGVPRHFGRMKENIFASMVAFFFIACNLQAP